MFKKKKKHKSYHASIPKNELFSSISHLIGIILSIIGTTILITLSINSEKYLHAVLFLIYGSSMILLYTMSTLYHMFAKGSKIKQLFRKFDHISIFILIAGTYTPPCLILMPNVYGKIILIAVWGFAILGIIFKSIYINSPGWINGCIFILMGWSIIFGIKLIYEILPTKGFVWLGLGGILYTLGGIVYSTSKKLNPIANMRMHDLFHILILLASFAHFWFMLKYVLPIN
ncbi:Conserved membrane protein (hemolysin III -like protein) [Borrelia hermsii YBT]|uniref:PAQR family membrane homeostasis protein TrhA n=1 Tax=Borrelia hermsii TaxID=140 RepID=UPI0003E38557|nr:hemolysin III family protein [Borrelia hermsii]AHH12135.1 Conserved membrane protein (hemolysin III -like protein) [Borrelia hermsii YBT]